VLCCIKDCDLEALYLGMCNKHWRRTRQYGSPVAIKALSAEMHGLTAIERFNRQHSKGANPDGCWTWTACVDKDGYGRFRGAVRGVVHNKAHRFSWAYHTDSVIPSGMMVCHQCDNVVCVNPAHLWLGDAADNAKDMYRKGRCSLQGFQPPTRAILNEAQVLKILADPRPYAQIASDYNVAITTIGSVKQRKSWGHLQVDVVAHPPPRANRRGKSNRINPEIVREIRTSQERGCDLAAKFKVSRQMISNIRAKRVWAHVA
jgi:hypothetical protein